MPEFQFYHRLKLTTAINHYLRCKKDHWWIVTKHVYADGL